MNTTVKVPAKVTLFGEWAVLYNNPGVATCLDVNFEGKIYKNQNNFKFISNQTEYSPSNIKNLNTKFEFVKKIIDNYKTSENYLADKHLSLNCLWNKDFGLGSSSAVAICLHFIFSKEPTNLTDTQETWRKIMQYYKPLHNGVSSGLDLAAQLSGGSVVLNNNNFKKIELAWPKNLKLIHTKEKVSTIKFKERLNLNKNSINNIARSTEKFLFKRNWQEAISEHHQELEKINAIPEKISSAFQNLVNLNIIKCFKTIGAGGGDGILCIVNEQKQNQLKSFIKENNFVLNPYNITSQGATKYDS